MFHVKQSPDSFFLERASDIDKGVVVERCSSNFLTPLLYSIKKPTCVYVDDSLFAPAHEQNQLNWDKDRVLWVPPKAVFLDDIPVGFKSFYGKSIQLLKSVSSSLWEDVRLVVCSVTQQGLKIPTSPSKPFFLDKSSEYDKLIDFLNNNQYQRVELVVDSLQFAVRGAIVDFFPPTSDLPIRAGFYVEDAVLHRFDVNSQTTTSELKSFKVAVSLGSDNNMPFSNLIGDGFDILYLDKHGSLSKKRGGQNNLPFPYK